MLDSSIDFIVVRATVSSVPVPPLHRRPLSAASTHTMDTTGGTTSVNWIASRISRAASTEAAKGEVGGEVGRGVWE
jgi:hypothetical protein